MDHSPDATSVELVTAGPAFAAGFARSFAELGLLEDAIPLLADLGWDGTVRPTTVEMGDGSLRHQKGFTSEERRARGIHYTPPDVAAGLVGVVLAGQRSGARVGDPACGAGSFLLGVAEWLRLAGAPVEAIIADQLFGADLDATAVALARVELAWWAAHHTGRLLVVPDDHLQVVDGLGSATGDSWVDVDGRLDVVIGNPPYGSQLKGGAVRTRTERDRLADALGVGAVGYADTAALFLLHATRLVRDGGAVSMILPTSIAAASGARRIRAAVVGRTRPRAVWIGGDDVGFDATVNVWAPVLDVGASRDPTDRPVPISRYVGRGLDPAGTVVPGDDPGNWAPLLADIPMTTSAGHHRAAITLRNETRGPTLDAVATVTAGFRQHFYGLAPHVVDDTDGVSDWPLLVTTGAIDPLHHRVSDPVRFAGRRWTRPVVDLESLERTDPRIAEWVRALLVPKVLIASQSRVIEVVVDPEGTMVPSTPAIAAVPHPGSGLTVWHVAAALCAPAASHRLHREAGGTGLGKGGCRVTARFVGSIHLPVDRSRWDVAAKIARRATMAAARRDPVTWSRRLDEVATLMLSDGSVGTHRTADGPEDTDALYRWWRQRRPEWRRARTLSR